MNALRIESLLDNKYGYAPLSKELSNNYRKFYISNLPDFLNLNGSIDKLYTLIGHKYLNY